MFQDAELIVEKNEWTPELEKYLKAWEDLTPIQAKASKIVHDSIERAYATQGASTGQSWPPRKDENAWPLLQKSGKMRALQLAASAGQFSNTGGELIADFGDILNVTDYSAFHASGTINMSQRQTLDLTQEEIDQLMQTVVDHVLILDR